MKKLRMISLLLILTFSFSVKAEVFVEIDCNGKEIESDKNVTCELNLIYEEVSINDVELSYNTNLDINFKGENGFTVNNTGNKVSLHTDEALYDEIMNSTVIMSFTLSSNDKVNEEEIVGFYNIKINKNDDELVDDVEEKFTIIKPKEEVKLDNICTLDSITVEEEKVKNFNKEVYEYRDIKVQKEVIFIDAVRTSDKSMATGLGNVIVPKGETIERDIIVTALDGTKNVYKLFITNIMPKVTITPVPKVASEEILPDEKVEVKSNDNKLKTLELYNNKKQIDFKFDITKDKYDINVDDISKITIKATLNFSKASFVNLFGPRDVTLDLEDNEILIKVKAENGDIKIYTLNIHVIKKDSDNTLLSLKVNDQVINLEDEEYEIKVTNDISKTKIEAISKSNKAIVEYEDIDLALGDNKVNIIVKAENGDTKEYVVNVIREEEIIASDEINNIAEDIDIPKEESSNTLYYIIGGVIVATILTIIVVIYIIKKKKSKKIEIIEEI